MTTLSRRHVISTAAALPFLPQSVWAQSAASGTTKFILPVSAGSGVDGIARAAASQLSKALGSTMVIENQAGAGGIVGTQSLVKAAPDGATFESPSCRP